MEKRTGASEVENWSSRAKIIPGARNDEERKRAGGRAAAAGDILGVRSMDVRAMIGVRVEMKREMQGEWQGTKVKRSNPETCRDGKGRFLLCSAPPARAFAVRRGPRSSNSTPHSYRNRCIALAVPSTQNTNWGGACLQIHKLRVCFCPPLRPCKRALPHKHKSSDDELANRTLLAEHNTYRSSVSNVLFCASELLDQQRISHSPAT
ncbi:hypothetical protein IE81DRAFT_60947 [Ceraceosorus guamensis]|uniref:Uncharacterized protein n=1 Tax=Ceraceosorus guamensis TaxID=1522189 RepID=A0A316W1Q9_9BASI|nr:hypothetical protein IE81DRAFT_60947 [Ceraceosorus guamensis]PWN43827.1 hypothetical protein IE81DRAFT_60947 [Ceraceosorus guamensis]